MKLVPQYINSPSKDIPAIHNIKDIRTRLKGNRNTASKNLIEASKA
jgi:hypothetical protein